jgi:hypothetical protein
MASIDDKGAAGFAPAVIKPRISLGDLDKIDIRVGTIERVANVPSSGKLVKLTVDFGDHKRSILAGIRRERADAKAEIEGRQALFVVNLEHRTWPARSRKACSSTSAMQMAWYPFLRFPKNRCQTDRARDEQCLPRSPQGLVAMTNSSRRCDHGLGHCCVLRPIPSPRQLGQLDMGLARQCAGQCVRALPAAE